MKNILFFKEKLRKKSNQLSASITSLKIKGGQSLHLMKLQTEMPELRSFLMSLLQIHFVFGGSGNNSFSDIL